MWTLCSQLILIIDLYSRFFLVSISGCWRKRPGHVPLEWVFQVPWIWDCCLLAAAKRLGWTSSATVRTFWQRGECPNSKGTVSAGSTQWDITFSIPQLEWTIHDFVPPEVGRDALTPFNTGNIARQCLTGFFSIPSGSNQSLGNMVTSYLDSCYNEVRQMSPDIAAKFNAAVHRIREIGSR